MRRVPSSSGRAIALAVAFCGLGIASGCGRETFDLLPDEALQRAGSAPNAAAGRDSGGAATTGGTGGKPSGTGGVSGAGRGGSAGRGPVLPAGGAGNSPCLGEGGCEEQEPCPVTAPFCTPCTSKQNCAFSEFCDAELRVCVQCRNDSQCRPGDECNPYTHRCAPACKETDDCVQDNEYLQCVPDLGVCVSCIKDGDCAKFGMLAPHCASSICVECTDHKQCPNQLCIGGRCSKP